MPTGFVRARCGRGVTLGVRIIRALTKHWALDFVDLELRARHPVCEAGVRTQVRSTTTAATVIQSKREGFSC